MPPLTSADQTFWTEYEHDQHRRCLVLYATFHDGATYRHAVALDVTGDQVLRLAAAKLAICTAVAVWRGEPERVVAGSGEWVAVPIDRELELLARDPGGELLELDDCQFCEAVDPNDPVIPGCYVCRERTERGSIPDPDPFAGEVQ